MKMLSNKRTTVRQIKLDVFYRRVSTPGQKFDLQIEADNNYRDKLLAENYIVINEVISANKVDLKSRPQMQKLIKLIKQHRVNTLFVYDRSRLARDYYEYIQIAQLLIEFDVNVEFTTQTNYTPFSTDMLLEGVNAMLIDEEGKAISRRNTDRQRRMPVRKFGYIVKRDNNNTITSYKINLQQKEVIQQLFTSATKINDYDEFLLFISDKARQFYKSVSDIIRYLSDPFYAGYLKVDNNFLYLNYVEPIISKESFISVDKSIAPFINKLNENIRNRAYENIFTPICAECQRNMRYRKSNLGESGQYTCSNKHKKIYIEVDTYNSSLFKITTSILNNLDSHEINSKVTQIVNSAIDALAKRIRSLEYEISSLKKDIVLGSTDDYQHKLIHLEEYFHKRNKVMEAYTSYQSYKQQTHSLVELITEETFHHKIIINKISFLIKSVQINDSTITYELYFNKYIEKDSVEKEFDKDVIYSK